MLCMSLSVMALFPLCLAVHHSPSSSMYFSKSFSNKVALGTTIAGTALATKSSAVTLSHSGAVHIIMNGLGVSPGKSPRQDLPLPLALQCDVPRARAEPSRTVGLRSCPQPLHPGRHRHGDGKGGTGPPRDSELAEVPTSATPRKPGRSSGRRPRS